MISILELAYKKHSDWNNIVKSFGCNPSMSEDVVMEMYIQLDADIKKGLDLYYKDEINHYYCYKVLRGIYTNLYKSSLRQKKVYLEDINELQEIEQSGIDEIQWAEQRDKIDNILNDLHWYDRKVFEIIAKGVSVAELSRNTKISYASLYNTYRNTKQNIKNKV